MLDRKLSPATVARRTAALCRAVKRARMVGLTRLTLETESPKAEAFRDTRGPGAQGWRRLHDQAEAEAAGGKPRAVRNLAILLLLHDRALRRSEVVAINFPADLDLSRPAVAIRGKGKNAKEWLTINSQTRDALTAHLALRGDWPGPLFVRADRREPAQPAAADSSAPRAGPSGWTMRASTGSSRRSPGGRDWPAWCVRTDSGTARSRRPSTGAGTSGTFASFRDTQRSIRY